MPDLVGSPRPSAGLDGLRSTSEPLQSNTSARASWEAGTRLNGSGDGQALLDDLAALSMDEIADAPPE